MKKAPNDTNFLLHPSENEDPKELPDLLSYKTCTAYMGNLKISFMTSMFWGQFGTYIVKYAKNKNYVSIH